MRESLYGAFIGQQSIDKGVMMKMKEQKKNRKRLLLGICICGCLCMTACGADEDALFMESAQEISTEKISDLVSAEGSAADVSTDISEEEMQSTAPAKEQKIVVHVCGAVCSPGVYELEAESRVMDAVDAARGFTQDADTEYVNLATVLADGNKVRIPTKEEVTEMSQQGITADDTGVIIQQNTGNTSDPTGSLVNINTADEALLCTLPGIGSTRAQSIIQYRLENGSFSKIEDIMQVSGIKESSFQKIKEYITVN